MHVCVCLCVCVCACVCACVCVHVCARQHSQLQEAGVSGFIPDYATLALLY